MPPHDSADRVMTTTHVVKGEDLNHHKTLYGGRCAEWSIELAYITAANCFVEALPIVFMSIRSLSMREPARLGEIIQFTGRVDYIGEATVGVRVDGRTLHPKNDPKAIITGTFLFCTVDKHGKAVAHGLRSLVPESTAARSRWEEAEENAVPTHR